MSYKLSAYYCACFLSSLSVLSICSVSMNPLSYLFYLSPLHVQSLLSESSTCSICFVSLLWRLYHINLSPLHVLSLLYVSSACSFSFTCLLCVFFLFYLSPLHDLSLLPVSSACSISFTCLLWMFYIFYSICLCVLRLFCLYFSFVSSASGACSTFLFVLFAFCGPSLCTYILYNIKFTLRTVTIFRTGCTLAVYCLALRLFSVFPFMCSVADDTLSALCKWLHGLPDRPWRDMNREPALSPQHPPTPLPQLALNHHIVCT